MTHRCRAKYTPVTPDTRGLTRLLVLITVVVVIFGQARTTHAANSQNRTDNRLRAQALAEQLANEYALAQAGGAKLNNVSGVRSAIELLARGVRGSGAGKGFTFRVEEATGPLAASASEYLKFDNHILRYVPPTNYRIAWTTGFLNQKKSSTGESLNDLMLEKEAKAIVRVFGSARASGANLSNAQDLQSTLTILENGITGEGNNIGIKFSIKPLGATDRARMKKMLAFHDGNLHFISESDRRLGRKIETISRKNRPAQLAQKIVALFNAAASTGANLGNSASPAQLIDQLRLGVRSKNEMGEQFFRISTDASQTEWNKSIAYLRLENGTLRYAPPASL